MSYRKYPRLTLFLVLLALAGVLGIVVSYHMREKPEALSGIVYTCPMHCLDGKTYSAPGRCPVCQMELVPLSNPQMPRDTGSQGGRYEVQIQGKTSIGFSAYQVQRRSIERILWTAGRLSPDGLWLRAEVDPTAAVGFQKGGLAIVTLDADASSAFVAKIESLSKGGRVVLRLSRPAPGNHYAQAQIIREQPDCLAIPLNSVWYQDGKDFVFRMEKGSPQMREVQLGLKGEHFVEVAQGLVEGDTIAQSGLFFLNAERVLKGTESAYSSDGTDSQPKKAI
jgi:hypothetical protein